MKICILLLLVLCVSICSRTVAQMPVEKHTHIGLSVMPQLGKMHVERNGNIDNTGTLAFSMSGDFYIDFSSRWQLNTGLEWQYVGWNYRDQSAQWPSDVVNGEFVPGHGGNYIELDYAQHYIGLPLLLRYNIGIEHHNQFFLQGGARIRRLINTSGYYQFVENHQTIIRHELEGSVFFEPVKTKIFWVIGFGFEMKLGNRKVFVNPACEFSLSNMYEEIGSSAIANGNTSFLGLRVGIR